MYWAKKMSPESSRAQLFMARVPNMLKNKRKSNSMKTNKNNTQNYIHEHDICCINI